ncbi:SDR family NAD(P)-dependent oxidoreductase [Marivibrio halodurans]|uniref:SDR family NAD(P)-dependent oxidoreductase n=1 Tax=Marivibrio halodurans TaxID=2039722 RepID=A0A8J7S2Y0_9PROT|nr:SDR family NAD(P)-dependent oxidoreductase [Marivibrio halodurans]MBP5858865.1 SDR family NAD(P)-dependent oxidoreductase [Marivibrio halodurans]
MTILVTGAAGFIGSHVVRDLAARGQRVVGIDNLNDYYDPTLKQARLATLNGLDGFTFEKIDIADRAAIEDLFARRGDITRIVHLAAQAGVRYSLENPHAYIEANILGQLNILEGARRLAAEGRLEHMVYASSSSVYGGNTKVPFSTDDRVDTPVSLYAATKRSDELMGHCYSHLYRIPMTGLRFFTVYGPWGRPDMAAYLFTDAMVKGRPIKVFNNGDMRRDFTFVRDIVAGVLAVLDGPPADGGEAAGPDGVPHRVYNIGNNRPEPLMRMIEVLEDALGIKAEIDFQPMQPGDVRETYADISAIARDFGYAPTTPIDVGIPEFVAWYRDYHTL